MNKKIRILSKEKKIISRCKNAVYKIRCSLNSLVNKVEMAKERDSLKLDQ